MRVTTAIASAAVIAAALLAGCNDKAPEEVVQTVDWYKANAPERAATLARCANNPGELATTPNCVNANRAEQAQVWGSRKSGTTQVKPLTPEQIRTP